MVCLAYNLKRLHVLLGGVLPSVALAQKEEVRQLCLLGKVAPIGLLRAVCRPVVRVGRLLFAHLSHHQHRTGPRRHTPGCIQRTIIPSYSFSPTGC